MAHVLEGYGDTRGGIEIGDPVEHRIISFDEGEKWMPATVVYVDYYQIGVVDADHTRRAIPRKSTEWRLTGKKINASR